MSQLLKMMTCEEAMNHINGLSPTDKTQMIQELFHLYLERPLIEEGGEEEDEEEEEEEEEEKEEEEEEEKGICLICGEESYHPNSQTCQRDGTCFNQGLYEIEKTNNQGPVIKKAEMK